MLTTTLPESSPATPPPHGPFAALRRKLPAGEVIRFLLVGGFNTVFSYALYVALVHAFNHLLPSNSKALVADIAAITSKPVAITVAFLGYKHFVFRTHGNYLKEWLRCFAVYGVSIPAELVIIFLATHVLLRFTLTHNHAQSLAGIVNSAVIASYSYFAHKKFSFKQ